MSFRNILLLVKDPAKTSQFLQAVTNLTVVHETASFIELNTSKTYPKYNSSLCIPIIIKEAANAAQLSTGYAPFMNFEIEDMDKSITSALVLGATLDGPIKYPAHGKFAAIRSPDGHMIGLFQSA